MAEYVNATDKRPDKDREMTFVEHLDELRGHIIRGVLAVIFIAIIAFFFKDFIFDKIILAPKNADFLTNKLLCAFGHILGTNALCINQNSFTIINIDIAGQFKAHLLVSFIIGLMIAFPYLVWELWRFFKPALKIKERVAIGWTLLAISLLFAVGVLFGYYLIVPLTINFLTTYQVSPQLINQISFQSYLSIILTLSFSTGLVFELPVLIYFLTKIGLLYPDWLKKQRKMAIVMAFVVAAIITPPDAFSQILVALPLLLLYELSISVSKRAMKKKVVTL